MSRSGDAENLAPPSATVRAGAVASATYIVGSLAYKVVAFLAVPILARLLTPAELGLLDLSVLVAGALAIAAVAGMDHAIARLDPLSDAGRLWTTAITVFVLVGGVLLTAVLLLMGPISRLILGEAAEPVLFAMAAAYGIAMGAMTMTMNAVRLYAVPSEFAFVGFVVLTTEIAAAIAVAAIGGSPQAILGLWAAISLMASVVIGMRRIPRLTGIDMTLAKKLAGFGLPLVPAAIVWHISEVGVRATIASSGDLGGLGAYGIVHRITSVLPLIAAGTALAWQPLVYRAPRDDQTAIAAQGVLLIVSALAIVGLAVSALSLELVAVVGGDAYAQGAALVPTLSLAAMLSGGFTMLTISAGLAFRTRPIAVLASLGAVIQVLGATMLVPGLGLSGAAFASVAGYASASLGAFVFFGWTSAAMAAHAVGVTVLAALGVLVMTAIGPESSVLARTAVALVSGVAIIVLVKRDSISALTRWRNRAA